MLNDDWHKMLSERAHRGFVWLSKEILASLLNLPSPDQIRHDTEAHFGVRPCIGQINAALAQMRKDSDVIYISGTGSGKTLTFWIPMLYETDSITILITTLNALGEQTASLLTKAGIGAINMTHANANNKSFQDIKLLHYRLIVVSPELLVQDSRFDKLWENHQFSSRLARLIFDEGHCISQWGASFRPEFAGLYKLRFLIPKTITFYIVSATLPKCILDDVCDKLHLKHDTRIIRRSNDRWNCCLIVHRIQNVIRTYKDLNFLFYQSDSTTHSHPTEKFLIFFNNRKEAEEAAEYIWKTFGSHLKERLVWFHSLMSDTFRATTLESFKDSSPESGIVALTCTDAAGMGLDISDITLIVQWRVPTSLCTLMQRFGRAARNLSLHAKCILMAEPRYFSDYKEAKEARTTKKTTQQTPQTQDDIFESSRPAKRPRIPKNLKSFVEAAVETAMDRFVNAERETPACRRAICNQYFNNDKLTPEESCCNRCQLHTPPLCCDLCEPSLLKIFENLEPSAGLITNDNTDYIELSDGENDNHVLGVKVRQTNTKPYTPQSQDILLKKELFKWREETYQRLGNTVDPYGFGSTIVMTDSVIHRLVDLAHYEKVSKIEDLKLQTKWCDDFNLSSEIFEIIQRIHPPIDITSLFTRTPRIHAIIPPDVVARVSGNMVSPLQRKGFKCSACGQPGHNARNKICPKKSTPKNHSFGSDISNHPDV